MDGSRSLILAIALSVVILITKRLIDGQLINEIIGIIVILVAMLLLIIEIVAIHRREYRSR